MILTKEMIKDQVLERLSGRLPTAQYCIRSHGWSNKTGPWQGHWDIMISSGKEYLDQFMFRCHPDHIGHELTSVFYRKNSNISSFAQENLSKDKEALVIEMIEEGKVEVLAEGSARFVLQFYGKELCGTYVIQQLEGKWGIYKTHHNEVK